VANIAVSGAELADGAELAASQPKRIVGKDDLSGTIPVLVLNIVDESLNIDRC
jgi:hypothetical protein